MAFLPFIWENKYAKEVQVLALLVFEYVHRYVYMAEGDECEKIIMHRMLRAWNEN